MGTGAPVAAYPSGAVAPDVPGPGATGPPPERPALGERHEEPFHREQNAEAPDQEQQPDGHHHKSYNEKGNSHETPSRVETNRTAPPA